MADLEGRVKKLEMDLAKLQRSALPFLAHQRGPLPGAMRAVSLGDPGLKSAMWMNLNGQAPGQAPYQAVSDANGTLRVELGNLEAFTDSNGLDSPAEYGLRVRDANNDMIFDSVGIAQVMKLLGHSFRSGGSGTITGNGSYQAASGTTVNVSLSRQVTLLALGLLNVAVITGGSVNVAVLVDGSYSTTNGPYATPTNSNSTPCTVFAVTTLAAGNHSLSIGIQTGNTFTYSYGDGGLYVFQLGG